MRHSKFVFDANETVTETFSIIKQRGLLFVKSVVKCLNGIPFEKRRRNTSFNDINLQLISSLFGKSSLLNHQDDS